MTMNVKERASPVHSRPMKSKNAFKPIASWILFTFLLVMLLLPIVASQHVAPLESSSQQDRIYAKPYGGLTAEEVIPLLSPHLGK